MKGHGEDFEALGFKNAADDIASDKAAPQPGFGDASPVEADC